MEPRTGYPPPNDDWWMSAMGRRTCRRCGEDRMTHSIIDGWGERMYCPVCSHDWTVSTNPAWQTRQQMGVPIRGSTGE